MNQRDLEVLSRFEEVWQRVQHGSTVSAESQETGIKELMDSLCYQWNGCRQLAMCTCGRDKMCLLTLSEQIKKQYRLLQLRYFLEEGDVYFSDESPNFASYTPYNLRKLWQITVENAEWLKKCNLKGKGVFVAEAERMKAETEQRKIVLEELIGRLLQ